MALKVTLGELLEDCALKYSDRNFLTIMPSGDTYSYAEFNARVNRIANGFQDQVGHAHKYAALILENSVDYLAISYALKKIDVIEVAINRVMRGAALARMVAQTETSIVFTSPAHLEALSEIRDDIPHVKTLVMLGGVNAARSIFPDLKIIPFDDLISDKTSHIRSESRDTDTAAIMFTSGTTGVSKGCVLSHRYAVRTAENMIAPFRLTSDDCIYSPYPLSHVGAAYYDILPMMMLGGRVIMRDGFSLSNFWPEINQYGATWFMMLGSVQQLLWAQPKSPEEKTHKVTRCWGTPVPVPKEDFDARFNLHLIPGGGYGSTDAGWVVVPQWDHYGGITLPHFEIAIVDENDEILPPNTPGELVVRPREPGVMSDEYFAMPERTAKSRRNLWFHTGDIARIDEDGLFYFMHRMSERIRVKGEMVSGFEVEEAVVTHPAIEDCAVIPVKSAFGEEDIKAFVTLKDGENLTPDALREYCLGRMAKFMVPAHFVILDEMPRTPTGKPEKGKLAAL